MRNSHSVFLIVIEAVAKVICSHMTLARCPRKLNLLASNTVCAIGIRLYYVVRSSPQLLFITFNYIYKWHPQPVLSLLKHHPDCSPHSKLAFKLNMRIIMLCNYMLYYRKSQTSSTCKLRTALINPVEPLKYPLLVLL